jgi:hypothetical protein
MHHRRNPKEICFSKGQALVRMQNSWQMEKNRNVAQLGLGRWYYFYYFPPISNARSCSLEIESMCMWDGGEYQVLEVK